MLFFNHSKIDILFRNINELNKLVAENIRTVEYVETGAKFLPTNVMHLTFYADGIRLDEGRFRTYAERATKSFMKDLSDGFFPSELQVSFRHLVLQGPQCQNVQIYVSFIVNNVTFPEAVDRCNSYSISKSQKYTNTIFMDKKPVLFFKKGHNTLHVLTLRTM